MRESMSSSACTPFPAHISMIGAVRLSPLRSCITSRGIIFPAAAREMILSRSPISPMNSCRRIRSSRLSMKCCTTEYLSSSSARSITGIDSQVLNRRAPIGEEHLSITSTSEVPSFPAVDENISRFLNVKRSIHTNDPSSMREIEHMLVSPVCWVCSRYISRAPADVIPRGNVSIAKPFSESTRSCLLSFSTALSYTNAHSSRVDI